MRFVAVLFVLACGSKPGVSTTTTTAMRSYCIEDDTVTVEFNVCLSSSCDTLVSSSCTVTDEGNGVIVSGEAVVESQGDVCTADCGLVRVDCVLPAGTAPEDVTLAEESSNSLGLVECSFFSP